MFEVWQTTLTHWVKRLGRAFLRAWVMDRRRLFLLSLLLALMRALVFFAAFLLVIAAFVPVWALRRSVALAVWWWRKLLVKPVNAVVILLVLFGLGQTVRAWILRLFRPETTIIISTFELSSTPPKDLPITGKTAADLLKDEVGEILSKARTVLSSVKNEPYGGKGQTRPRSVALGEKPEIAAVGIEVEGISFEKIFALYDAIRQDQRHVEGDVVFSGNSDTPRATLHLVTAEHTDSPCEVALQARMSQIGSWKSSSYSCDQRGLRQAAHELAENVIRDFSPNTLALYLQNVGRRKEAIIILRKLVAEDPTKIRSILDLAAALYFNSDYAGAIAEYREAMALKPKYPEQVLNNLALALYGNGQSDEAEAEYKRAIQLNKHYADPHNNLGNLLRLKGDRDGAIREFVQALRIDDDDADAHDNYGLSLDSQWKIEKAIHEFREAVRLQPDRYDLHLDLGAEFEKRGDYDAAITEYRESVRLNPNDSWTRTDLGNALSRNGEFEEAVREHRAALALKGDFPEAQNNLGATLEAEGSNEAAIDEYSWAIQLKPDFALARCNLAEVLHAVGEYEAFIINFKEAIDKSSSDDDAALAHRRFADALREEREFGDAIDHYRKSLEKKKGPDAYIGLGYVYYEQGKDLEAMKSFQEAKSLRDDADAHSGIGYVFEDMGRRSAAIDEYRQVLRLNRDDAFSHRLLANAMEAQGEYDAAKRERENAWAGYRLALQRRPKDWRTHMDIGRVLDEIGAAGDAIREFDSALQIAPEEAELHNDRGVAEERSNNQDVAIEEYRSAVNIKPNYLPGYLNLGRALNLEGQHEEAANVFRRALSITPDVIWVHTDLGLSYDDEGKYEEAIAEHRAAIETSDRFRQVSNGVPNFPEGHSNLCRALTHNGNYDLAITECRTALLAMPHSAEAHVNLAEALEAKSSHCGFCWKNWLLRDARKEYEFAVTETRAALNLRQDAEVYCISGQAHYGMGRDDKAIEQLQNALRWKQSYPKAHYYLGLALRRSGQSGEALKELAEAQRLDPHLVLPSD